jgi:formylglycine-generating enzyme required for sulfatase activity
MRIIATFACAVVLTCMGILPGHAEARVALVIGNRDYKPGVGALTNPLNDIRLVGDALRSVGFEVLPPLGNATRGDILRGIRVLASSLKAAGPDAIGFVYYSGHGIASQGENYLIPVDVTEPSTEQLEIQGVKQSEVLAILRQEAPNAAHYLVLDACRNTLQGSRGGKGFVPVEQQNGVLVAFSTEPGKTARDTGAASGPYAAALAMELVKAGQDDLHMFHNIRVDVMEKTNRDQVPWTEDGIQRRNRPVFARGTSAAYQPTRPQAESPPTETPSQGTVGTILSWFAGSSPAPQSGDSSQQVAMLARPKGCEATTPVSLSKRAPQPLSAVTEGCLAPMDVFSECGICPKMTVVPAGGFTMGSPGGEPERDGDREAQVPVKVSKPFAVGKYAVTFEEWDACVADGGCGGYKPSDVGLGRGLRPVVNVTWDDAQKYVSWLSGKTGKSYRLLSDAEREYVTRAGSTTPFWWGSSIAPQQANYDGSYAYDGGGRGEYRKKTTPVDEFEPNAWGLYQVHGNVWEWTQDCWNDGNGGSARDGSARADGDCKSRVIRGGSWDSKPQYLRSAVRVRSPAANRDDIIGFRVARTLAP